MGWRQGAALAFAVGLVAGCGEGGSRSDGGSGTAGSGLTGTGGSAGGAGSGASGGAGTGTGGTGGGPPLCPIALRPNDPVNPDGGVATNCNTVAFGGDWVTPEVAAASDGGVALDGGASEEPTGGTMIDGDYDLVRFRVIGSPGGRTRRSLRIFDGGTYWEWLVGAETPTGDGGMVAGQISLNTLQQPSAPPFSVTIICNRQDLIGPEFTYAYTATGEELVLFNYYTGRLVNIYTYRRACAR